MAAKDDILKKIEILITKHYKTPEDAFHFFDEDGNSKLSTNEIKNLLKDAEISGFIRGIVSSKLIEGYDKDKDGYINWKEFKAAVAEIAEKTK